MAKPKRKCWNCGQPTMEPDAELGKDWLRCSNCGSTASVDPLEISPSAFGGEYKGADGVLTHKSVPFRGERRLGSTKTPGGSLFPSKRVKSTP